MDAEEMTAIAEKTAEILAKKDQEKQAAAEKTAAEQADAFELGVHMFMEDAKIAEEHRPAFLQAVGEVITAEQQG
jgi:hypothetical protein